MRYRPSGEKRDARRSLVYRKALGVAKARSIYEEQFERKVTQQELADLLTGEGYRVTQSNISRMEYAVTHLFPHLSSLFYMGLSRTQVLPLINLYSAAEKGWKVLCQESAVLPLAPSFEVVFASACSRLELTALTDYSLEYLKDELMGELVKALPDPTITWDRWLIELIRQSSSVGSFLAALNKLMCLSLRGRQSTRRHPHHQNHAGRSHLPQRRKIRLPQRRRY